MKSARGRTKCNRRPAAHSRSTCGFLIRPPGADNLALRIYDLFHYGPSAQVGALCVLTVALSALAFTPLLLAREEA